MALSETQRDLLDYLADAERVTATGVARHLGPGGMRTVHALMRRGLATAVRQPNGVERFVLTDKGRRRAAERQGA